MSTRGIILLALCGACAIVLLFAAGPPDTSKAEVATRYSDIVNGVFIKEQWLRLAAPGSRQNESEMPRLVWSWPEDPTQRQLARQFFRDSYLQQDITRFNDPRVTSDRSLFDIRHNRLLGISLSAHAYHSPFEHRSRWLGKLLYASGPSNKTLVLQPVEKSGQAIVLTALSRGYQHEAETPVSVFATGSPEAIEGANILFVDRAHQPIARLWRVGDDVVIVPETRPSSSDPERRKQYEVWVDGHQIREDSRQHYYRVPRGALLLFEDRTARKVDSHPRQSWVLGQQSAPDAIYDGSLGGAWHNSSENTLFPRVVEVLSSFVAGTDSDSYTDVTLTLSRSLETRAAQILQSQIRRVAGDEIPTDRSIAALTLMDGLTGELLALPSLPVPPGLAGLPDRYRLDTLPENHNFTRLPVGSVAKILLGAAILDTHPDLLALSLAPNPTTSSSQHNVTFSSVLGIGLERDIHDHPTGDWLDLRHAIASSINHYAATLLTLGSDDPSLVLEGSRSIDVPTDWIRLGGNAVIKERPQGLVFDSANNNSFVVPDLKWVARAQQLYDINTTSTQVLNAPERVARDYVWDGLPSSLEPRSEAGRRLLATISPERENLRLDDIQRRATDFSERFIPLILGDGESRWSNVELAEAFASLVQNRRIRASLLDTGQRHELRRELADLKLNHSVQKALTDGMALVINEPSGTAWALEKSRQILAAAACTQKHQVFGLFGKTGSPELARTELSPESRVFNSLVGAGILLPDPQTGAVRYRLAEQRSEEVTPELIQQLQDNIRRGNGAGSEEYKRYFTRAAGLSACGNVASPKLWREVFLGLAESYNLSHTQQPNVRIAGGTLFSDRECFVRPKDSRHAPFGKHFVFVAALYKPEAAHGGLDSRCTGGLPDIDVSQRPERAIAGAVTVQDPALVLKDTDIAVHTANDLLCGPIVDQLGLKIDRTACLKNSH